MGLSIIPAASSSPTPLPTSVPSGLTLRNTYTSTTSSLSFPTSPVFAVVIGGGGGGSGAQVANNAGQGGGGGAVVMGWVSPTTVATVGAGGTGGGAGSSVRSV